LQNQSEYIAQLQSSVKWKRLGEFLQLEGIALAPGTFTGLDGQTINYPRDVVLDSAESVLGKPIIWKHSDGAEPKELVVGFLGAVGKNHVLKYKGVVWDPLTIERIESGELGGDSIEAKVKAVWNPGLQCMQAVEVEHTALALQSYFSPLPRYLPLELRV